jgi:hypothetical protein
MLDKNLVHAIIGSKDLDCGSAELSVNRGLVKLGFVKLGWTDGHGSLLLDLIILPSDNPRPIPSIRTGPTLVQKPTFCI